jgi:hypothetical protein
MSRVQSWLQSWHNQARQLGAFSIMHLRRVCTESLLLCIMNRRKDSRTANETETAARPTNQRPRPINSQTDSQTSFPACMHDFPSSPVSGLFFRALEDKKKKKIKDKTKGSAPKFCVVCGRAWCVAHPSLCREPGARSIFIGFSFQCSIR